MFNKLLLVFLAICSFYLSQGQTAELSSSDSSVVVKKKRLNKSYDYSKLDPKRASIYSAILPGLGQAYNRRFWKLPIIYGLGGYTVYKTIVTNKSYKVYANGMKELEDTGAGFAVINIKGTERSLSKTQLKQEKDYFKRQRDIHFIATLAIYALQIVDASVDAHLLKFHNSENFLSLTPTIIDYNNGYSPGFALTLNLRD